MNKPKTHLRLADNDPHEFYTVSDKTIKLSNNFWMYEFYNPKTKLKEHPIAKKVVDVAQILRDYFGVPWKTSEVDGVWRSTYRNYIPQGKGVYSAATKSPHMLAQAADLVPYTDEQTRNDILMQIRDDWEKKGDLFRVLWYAGCRGFGVYDTFVHVDVVVSELYPAFSARRTSKHKGEMYAYWNKMGVLRYKKPSIIILDQRKFPGEKVKAPNGILDNTVVHDAAGAVMGTISELTNDADAFQDGSNKVLYTIATILLIAFAAIMIYRFSQMRKKLSST